MEVDTIWTRLFSTALTYNNGYYQYQNSGGQAFYFNNVPSAFGLRIPIILPILQTHIMRGLVLQVV